MADSNSRTRLLGDDRTPNPTETPLYHGSQQDPTTRLMHLAFVAVIVVMVLITFILSIYRSSAVSGMYIVLGLSLLALVLIEIVMVRFMKTGDLPPEKAWFLYFLGFCIFLESIFTNVLLFQ